MAQPRSATLHHACYKKGGVAVDDYSDHCWTLHEIESALQVDGLGFFDFRTYHDRACDQQLQAPPDPSSPKPGPKGSTRDAVRAPGRERDSA